MKKTLIETLPTELPQELDGFIRNAKIYDSSSSPEARVYFIDRDCGYYLKIAKPASLYNEAKMTEYFHSLSLGAQALYYETKEECDFFMTERLAGEDCTHTDYLSDPKRLCDTIATELRRLHETDYIKCPIKQRTRDYLEFAEKNYLTGNYDKSAFPDSFGYRSAEDAIKVLRDGKNELKCDTLLHGDYCLPNILLDGWKLSGFIDLGAGGVGDRHIDLFWGAWTLAFNLKTDKYRNRFFDAYGRDKVDTDLIKVVAAAEVFG